MAKLSMTIPAPSVDLSEGAFGDGVSVAALNRVDSLSGGFEALDDLGDVVGVDVAQTELSILVVLAHSVH